MDTVSWWHGKLLDYIENFPTKFKKNPDRFYERVTGLFQFWAHNREFQEAVSSDERERLFKMIRPALQDVSKKKWHLLATGVLGAFSYEPLAIAQVKSGLVVTPSMVKRAKKENRPNILKAMIEENPKIATESLFLWACTYQYLELAETVFHCGVISPDFVKKALFEACWEGRFPVAQLLLKQNLLSPQESPPRLHRALIEGRVQTSDLESGHFTREEMEKGWSFTGLSLTGLAERANQPELLKCLIAKLSDRKLQIGTKIVPVNTAQLRSRSPYFNALLGAEYRDAKQELVVLKESQDWEAETLEQIHRGFTIQKPFWTRFNFKQVVAVACRFQIGGVKELLLPWLVQQPDCAHWEAKYLSQLDSMPSMVLPSAPTPLAKKPTQSAPSEVANSEAELIQKILNEETVPHADAIKATQNGWLASLNLLALDDYTFPGGCLQWAVRQQQVEMTNLLMDKTVDLVPTLNLALRDGFPAVIKPILARLVALNQPLALCLPAFMHACRSKRMELVEPFLAAGVRGYVANDRSSALELVASSPELFPLLWKDIKTLPQKEKQRFLDRYLPGISSQACRETKLFLIGEGYVPEDLGTLFKFENRWVYAVGERRRWVINEPDIQLMKTLIKLYPQGTEEGQRDLVRVLEEMFLYVCHFRAEGAPFLPRILDCVRLLPETAQQEILFCSGLVGLCKKGGNSLLETEIVNLLSRPNHFQLSDAFADLLPGFVLYEDLYFHVLPLYFRIVESSSLSDPEKKSFKSEVAGEALSTACQEKSWKSAKFLVDQGADPTLVNAEDSALLQPVLQNKI